MEAMLKYTVEHFGYLMMAITCIGIVTVVILIGIVVDVLVTKYRRALAYWFGCLEADAGDREGFYRPSASPSINRAIRVEALRKVPPCFGEQVFKAIADAAYVSFGIGRTPRARGRRGRER